MFVWERRSPHPHHTHDCEHEIRKQNKNPFSVGLPATIFLAWMSTRTRTTTARRLNCWHVLARTRMSASVPPRLVFHLCRVVTRNDPPPEVVSEFGSLGQGVDFHFHECRLAHTWVCFESRELFRTKKDAVGVEYGFPGNSSHT